MLVRFCDLMLAYERRSVEEPYQFVGVSDLAASEGPKSDDLVGEPLELNHVRRSEVIFDIAVMNCVNQQP